MSKASARARALELLHLLLKIRRRCWQIWHTCTRPGRGGAGARERTPRRRPHTQGAAWGVARTPEAKERAWREVAPGLRWGRGGQSFDHGLAGCAGGAAGG
jgi:hypothetical protein